MEIVKFYATLVFLFIIANCFSQTYVSGYLHNQSLGFNILAKEKNHYLGFGVTFFRNKGNKGQDYTNFINPNADVYEILNSKDGTIYGMYGRKYKNNIISFRLGAGTRKWVYNGKTNDLYWYIVKDGGTYLLYGLDYRKVFEKINTGISYDNFNGFGLSVGVFFK